MSEQSIDQKVAEKVMGWNWINEYDAMTKTNANILVPPGYGETAGPRPDICVPPFSTSRDAAMQVLAAIDKHGDVVSHRFYSLYDGFELKKITPGEKIEHVRIDPLEICEAALKAVNADES